MALPKRSNEPEEKIFRVQSEPPPPGDDPHDAATKVGQMPLGTLAHLMQEVEEHAAKSSTRPPPPKGPPRPDRPPSSGLRSSEIPSVRDEADDATLEPTLIKESSPESLRACAQTEPVDPLVGDASDVVAAIVSEMSRAPESDPVIPKLSYDEDDKLVTERGTELMSVRPASRPSMTSPSMSMPSMSSTSLRAPPRAPAFPEWVGVSMKFSVFGDHGRRDLLIRVGIAVAAFVVTISVLLWLFLG